MTERTKLRSFASSDRFIAEVAAAASSQAALRAGYVLAGDEIFLYERCRRAVMHSLLDPSLRDFCLSDLDLAETNIFSVLDHARTPSLMAPFQAIFVRNIKNLYTRGAKKEEFAALSRLFSFTESPRRCPLRGRPFAHSRGSAADGHAGQGTL